MLYIFRFFSIDMCNEILLQSYNFYFQIIFTRQIKSNAMNRVQAINVSKKSFFNIFCCFISYFDSLILSNFYISHSSENEIALVYVRFQLQAIKGRKKNTFYWFTQISALQTTTNKQYWNSNIHFLSCKAIYLKNFRLFLFGNVSSTSKWEC